MRSILRLGTALALCIVGISSAHATQNGGNIAINASASTTFTVGTGPGQVSITADSNGSGNGGEITINSAGQFVVDSGAISAKAGPSGNGKGGTITGTTVDGDMVLSGAMNVDGQGSGMGGTITLTTQGASSNFDITTNSATFSANGGSDGGAGGSITVLPGNTFCVASRLLPVDDRLNCRLTCSSIDRPPSLVVSLRVGK